MKGVEVRSSAGPEKSRVVLVAGREGFFEHDSTP
jgi:hypothetical protein